MFPFVYPSLRIFRNTITDTTNLFYNFIAAYKIEGQQAFFPDAVPMAK